MPKASDSGPDPTDRPAEPVAAEAPERKLTTILATDVVGFSEMMGRDEAGTLALLKGHGEVIKDTISGHRGRLFGGAGDSFLADFSSPLQAVLCANEFQRAVAARNAAQPEHRRMWFRVGINLGDVIIDGDNLFGEGVNVAARLEQVGEPGGICVSRKVYDEVRRNLGLPFVDGGVQQLKNIADPVPVYHVRPVTDGAVAGPPAPGPAATGRKVAPERQMVAVRPFRSAGEEAEFLAEGLRESLTDSLAKYSAIAVLHDEAGAGVQPDFVLEGAVRAQAGRVRLSFALTETHGRRQVWSERYDRARDESFALEDEVAQAVASVVRIRLKALAFEALRDSPNELLTVPELLSKAAGYFVDSPGNNDEVEVILRRAVAERPENSMAQAMLAFCLYRRHELSPLALPAPLQEEIRALTRAAVHLDGRSYFAHLLAAVAAQEIDADWEAALAHGEAALDLNPNFTQALAMVGIARCHLGRAEEGLTQLRRAIEANREDPHRFRHIRELALAQCLAGEPAEAEQTITRLVRLAPDLARNRLALVAIAGLSGTADRARAAADELRQQFPALRLAQARPFRIGDAETAAAFAAALRAAGLPD